MSDVEKGIEKWRAGLTGSECLAGSDIDELENHLREAMQHLKATGLSADEAFLVARHRLGDTTALEEEFAKVSPYRRPTHRLSWMAVGVLGYFLLLHLSTFATYTFTLLGRTLGLRHSYVAVLACITQVAAFGGIGALVLRYYALRRQHQAAYKKAPHPIRASVFAACAIVAMYWIESLYRLSLVRTMGVQDFGQFMQAQFWASFGWSMLTPFLAVGVIAILPLFDRRRTEAQ